MANRVLRDWTTSDSMDKLSAGAEVFFTRLIMKADDFGSYFANCRILKSGLFPLKDSISENTVKGWVDECVSAGLLMRYRSDGKDYIRINNFNQRLRNMRNAFPHPPEGNPQRIAATRSELPPETKRNETETEVETETETKSARAVEEKTFVAHKETKELIEAICDYFEIRQILTSPVYNQIHDFAMTAQHRNEVPMVSMALQKYMTYKARSQEARHNVTNWIGSKDEHYRDGQWYLVDWTLKEKNYKQPNGTRIKGTSGQNSPEPGKDYTGGF